MDKSNNKNIIVKLICVILSFGLWLYVSNVENPTRTSDVKNIEVEIQNTDVLTNAGLAISPDQTYTVDLKLEGPANVIYTVKKSDFVITADLSDYALKSGENNIPVEIVSYPDGVTIKNSGVLSVKVNLEELTEKDVKVTSNVATSYKNGYSEDDIDISPETVTVSGPKSAVDSVAAVELQGELLNISEDITEEFDLVAVDSSGDEVTGVTLSQTTGELSIGVGTRKQVTINPNYTGTLSSNLQLDSIELSKTKVQIIGNPDKINDIDVISTEPIDLSTITESGSISVKLLVPSGVYISSGEYYITANVKVSSVTNTDTTTTEDTTDDAQDTTTSKTLDGIKVKLSDANSSTLTYSTADISVELSGLESELSSVTADNISAVASVSDITEAGEYEISLIVSMDNVGQSVQIKSKPEKVTVTVT